MRYALLLPLFVVMSLVAGCAGPGQSIIYNRQIDATYRPSTSFWTQTAGRDLQTEVYGNPFAADDATLAAAVTSAMHGAHFGPETNFTTTPGEHNAHPYRVRLLFNALPTSGMSLCADTPSDVPAAPIETTADGVNVRLLAAYCVGDSRITSLNAGIDGVTGPDDPAFITFIRQVTTSLFPPNNLGQNGDRCFMPDC